VLRNDQSPPPTPRILSPLQKIKISNLIKVEKMEIHTQEPLYGVDKLTERMKNRIQYLQYVIEKVRTRTSSQYIQ